MKNDNKCKINSKNPHDSKIIYLFYLFNKGKYNKINYVIFSYHHEQVDGFFLKYRSLEKFNCFTHVNRFP